ncbi:penicillin-binding transpeptidase domain-containing protein [Streptomyces poriferorum]|uniref:Penicillin-binding transpeptidase domain-containing protein n=1 Tax=Streptomyces poriferorum TaxID=2798799 RepID=A0ABY9ISJ8_9ACTN|nr:MULTISPECIES: penicillin-binding transpeptidase domain-containing protein [Streptomyces]MBW5252333.1 penicillin-binding protein 2 [Streptomyces poriferorum]MBW5260079.1 penicillin-binding protein 2 [Streptomyces poriferorum]MDP5313227.1 penicillin-binding transpeptidase domain-containing protein [Streptomyces sp. Alt4]WLQ49533.1 penicillin-binding transpeptidase domain-containing protein [Streptomyces sp. Alt1]WLQ57784.1 penicillin-binding transpeptidase domain-containing protein [Streptomy
MNKPLRRIAIFCGVLIFALLARTNYLQYVKADELNTRDENRRVRIERYAHERGNIIVDGGAEITGSAETKDSDFKYKRVWKNGPMWAPVTGYSSQAFGATQLESIEDGILTGNDDQLFFDNTMSMFTGDEKQGGNVVTTLNSAAQKAAFEGLGNKKGAVAALDPQTGAILALASTPSYDPSTFAGNSDKDSKAWQKLQKDKDKPMLNRALRETYPPGSTFKVVTAAAALENGLYTDIDAATKSPLPWRLPLTTGQPLANEGNIPCENASLREALRMSCNTVFGKISDDLGNQKMIDQADKFGFNKEIFTPVRSAASIYPKDNRPQNAMAGIGQASNRTTPLQMAMVASAVANDGKLMQPYMVAKRQSPSLDDIYTHETEQLSQPISGENAQKLQQMMETVVNSGTGTNAKIDGATVGGKTGTAQHGLNNSEKPYAWFISYAKTDDGSPVAVAVVVEDGEANRDDISGGGLAAPIAKAVMKAVIDGKK